MDFNRICIGCMREKEQGEERCRKCGFDLSNYQIPQYALPPFTILQGKYLIGKVLGAGGFGITYLSFDMNLEHAVAIKEYYVRNVMYRDNTTTSVVTVSASDAGQQKVYQVNRERFEKEAKMLAKLEYMNGIVRVYDYFSENSTAYIVMEYLPGPTLKQYLREKGGRLSWAQTMKVMHPVMESLQKLHEQDIIHRDISPDNMMFSMNGDLKLVDFGGAKQDIHEAEDQRSSVIMTKKGYSPVEQLMSGKKQGSWTDEYALAATIYSCLCGKAPEDAVERLTGMKLTSPRQLGVDISVQQEQVLLKGLAIKQEDRYPSVGEFMTSLDAAAPGGSSSGTWQSIAGSAGVSGTYSSGSSPSGISGQYGGSSTSGISGQSGNSRPSTPGMPDQSASRPSTPGMPGQSASRLSTPGMSSQSAASASRPSPASGSSGSNYSSYTPAKKKKSPAGKIFAAIIVLLLAFGGAYLAGQNGIGPLKDFSFSPGKEEEKTFVTSNIKKYDSSGKQIEYTTFSYNDKGKLKERITYDMQDKELEKTTYAYWENGSIKQIESVDEDSTYTVSYRKNEIIEKSSGTYSDGYKYSYVYDNNGYMFTYTWSSSDGTTTLKKYENETDSEGKLIKSTAREKGELKEINTYTYWSNGNKKQERDEHYYDGKLSSSYEYSYEEKYGDMVSSYYYDETDSKYSYYTLYTNEYDSEDRFILYEFQEYTSDGQKKEDDWSYGRTEYDRDSEGKISERRQYDSNHQLEYREVYEYIELEVSE